MDFRIFVEPQQGATYADQLAVAQASERLGFSGFFRSDHILAMGEHDALPGPTDSWVTLGAIARETSTIRLGTLVTSATFRWPALLAIAVAQVDEMSGGRVELGLGTGWFEAEHTAYGVPFPSKRFDPFTEQLEILTGLWSTPVGEAFDYEGEHYRLRDAPALPQPVQAPLPLIIGGGGPSRTPALAARFAHEYNAAFTDPGSVAAAYTRVRQACEEIGRDPAEVTYSFAHTVAVSDDPAELEQRAADAGTTPSSLRDNGLGGTVAEVVDTLGAYQEAGVERVYLQFRGLADLDHLELIAREVVTQL